MDMFVLTNACTHCSNILPSVIEILKLCNAWHKGSVVSFKSTCSVNPS